MAAVTINLAPPCSCPLAGYCERHGIHKTDKLRRLCLTNGKMRMRWDRLAKGGTPSPPAKALPPAPDFGPGTELKKILTDQLGIDDATDCGCAAMVAAMNRWGVAGCRENRKKIIAKLRQNAKKRGWGEKWGAALEGLKTGLAWSINPLNPIPSLVDLAIARAEAAELDRRRNPDAAEGS